MKVSLPQSILSSMLARGTIAAVSSEADNDITHLASAVQSVRITVEENLTIESATPFLVVKATIPITPESEIVVKETGSVLVNAKDLCTWVEKQNDCRIALSLTALVHDPATADNSSDITRKIGTLSLASKDEHKTGSKWSMEAFDPNGMIKTKNGANIVPLFNITVPNLYAAIANTEFSCNEKDDARMYNCISFQNANGDPYFVCTDTCRCAMYKMTDLMTDASDFTKNGDSRMLIPAKTFYSVVNALRDAKDIAVTYDVDRDGLLLATDGFVARIALPEKAMFANFPSVVTLLQKNYEVIGTVKRTRLINRMNTLAMISKMSCLFDVKGSMLRAYVSPDCPGKSAATCTCEIENPLHDGRYVWGIQHLMDILKALEDEMVPIQVDAASNTFKVTSEKDKNVIFFGMHIDSPKYAKVILD